MFLEFIDSYFFSEVSPIPYVVMRIFVGLLFLFMFFELVVSYELIAPIDEGGLLYKSQHSLWNVPTIFKRFGCSYSLFLWMYLICSVCIIIGFFSVLFLILMFYLHLSFRSYASGIIGGSDHSWRSGFAVWNVMNFPDRHKWKWLPKFLVNKKIIIQFMTYYVMIVEVLTPIGFFVKPLIPVWVFLLTCMHIGIELTMFVGLFGYCMFAFLIFLLLTYFYW